MPGARCALFEKVTGWPALTISVTSVRWTGPRPAPRVHPPGPGVANRGRHRMGPGPQEAICSAIGRERSRARPRGKPTSPADVAAVRRSRLGALPPDRHRRSGVLLPAALAASRLFPYSEVRTTTTVAPH